LLWESYPEIMASFFGKTYPHLGATVRVSQE